MGPDATALKQGILAHDGAVDALIPLLKDPDERVAELASYMLRDAPAIDPAYLPDIIDGLDRDLGWLAPALARIGTDEAAKEAVDRFLVSDSAPGNQEAYALQLFGRQAIPLMLERAACTPSCGDDTHYLLGAVLGRMGPERAAAGPRLIQIASDPEASPQVARGALRMITELGTVGRALEHDLLRLREESPRLSSAIDDALIGIQSKQAGRIFTERLTGWYDVVTLRDLAEVGTAGRDAGAVVLSILEQEPELRTAAATTLGYIGYAEATPALIKALDDPADVTLTWSAARALERIGARDALAALDRTAGTHWYAPVREVAGEAAAAIRSGGAESERSPGDHFPTEFFAFQSINRGLPKCERNYDAQPESSPTKLYYVTAGSQLKQLKYPAEVVGYGANDEDEQKQAGAEIIEVHLGNLVEHRETIEQTPHVALRVDEGWLVGGSRGEWGGELGFLGDDGHFQQIFDVNVQDIHRLGDRIVALTGLAHLGHNRGIIVAVERQPDGQWQASPWRVLPGAPMTSIDASSGLTISIAGGGAIRVGADGEMEMADCPP